MPELPVVFGPQAVRAFQRLGWVLQRQAGSHMILTRPGSIATLSVPNHHELAAGTQRRLIRPAGLNVADFIDALRK